MTRDAADVIRAQELHALLCLDGISTSWVAFMRDQQGREIAEGKRRALRCDRLAALAADFRESLVAAVEEDERAWERAVSYSMTDEIERLREANRRLTMENRRLAGGPEQPRSPSQAVQPPTVPGETWGGSSLGVVADVRCLTSIVEAAARRMVAYATTDAQHARTARPRHDDKGARARDAAEIRRRLVELRERLRRADPRKWTVAALARLIIASSNDWTDPPCPELVARYSSQEALAQGRNRGASPLAAWITTHLTRASKRKRTKPPRT